MHLLSKRSRDKQQSREQQTRNNKETTSDAAVTASTTTTRNESARHLLRCRSVFYQSNGTTRSEDEEEDSIDNDSIESFANDAEENGCTSLNTFLFPDKVVVDLRRVVSLDFTTAAAVSDRSTRQPTQTAPKRSVTHDKHSSSSSSNQRGSRRPQGFETLLLSSWQQQQPQNPQPSQQQFLHRCPSIYQKRSSSSRSKPSKSTSASTDEPATRVKRTNPAKPRCPTIQMGKVVDDDDDDDNDCNYNDADAAVPDIRELLDVSSHHYRQKKPKKRPQPSLSSTSSPLTVSSEHGTSNSPQRSSRTEMMKRSSSSLLTRTESTSSFRGASWQLPISLLPCQINQTTTATKTSLPVVAITPTVVNIQNQLVGSIHRPHDVVLPNPALYQLNENASAAHPERASPPPQPPRLRRHQSDDLTIRRLRRQRGLRCNLDAERLNVDNDDNDDMVPDIRDLLRASSHHHRRGRRRRHNKNEPIHSQRPLAPVLAKEGELSRTSNHRPTSAEEIVTLADDMVPDITELLKESSHHSKRRKPKPKESPQQLLPSRSDIQNKQNDPRAFGAKKKNDDDLLYAMDYLRRSSSTHSRRTNRALQQQQQLTTFLEGNHESLSTVSIPSQKSRNSEPNSSSTALIQDTKPTVPDDQRKKRSLTKEVEEMVTFLKQSSIGGNQDTKAPLATEEQCVEGFLKRFHGRNDRGNVASGKSQEKDAGGNKRSSLDSQSSQISLSCFDKPITTCSEGMPPVTCIQRNAAKGEEASEEDDDDDKTIDEKSFSFSAISSNQKRAEKSLDCSMWCLAQENEKNSLLIQKHSNSSALAKKVEKHRSNFDQSESELMSWFHSSLTIEHPEEPSMAAVLSCLDLDVTANQKSKGQGKNDSSKSSCDDYKEAVWIYATTDEESVSTISCSVSSMSDCAQASERFIQTRAATLEPLYEESITVGVLPSKDDPPEASLDCSMWCLANGSSSPEVGKNVDVGLLSPIQSSVGIDQVNAAFDAVLLHGLNSENTLTRGDEVRHAVESGDHDHMEKNPSSSINNVEKTAWIYALPHEESLSTITCSICSLLDCAPSSGPASQNEVAAAASESQDDESVTFADLSRKTCPPTVCLDCSMWCLANEKCETEGGKNPDDDLLSWLYCSAKNDRLDEPSMNNLLRCPNSEKISKANDEVKRAVISEAKDHAKNNPSKGSDQLEETAWIYASPGEESLSTISCSLSSSEELGPISSPAGSRYCSTEDPPHFEKNHIKLDEKDSVIKGCDQELMEGSFASLNTSMKCPEPELVEWCSLWSLAKKGSGATTSPKREASEAIECRQTNMHGFGEGFGDRHQPVFSLQASVQLDPHFPSPRAIPKYDKGVVSDRSGCMEVMSRTSVPKLAITPLSCIGWKPSKGAEATKKQSDDANDGTNSKDVPDIVDLLKNAPRKKKTKRSTSTCKNSGMEKAAVPQKPTKPHGSSGKPSKIELKQSLEQGDDAVKLSRERKRLSFAEDAPLHHNNATTSQPPSSAPKCSSLELHLPIRTCSFSAGQVSNVREQILKLRSNQAAPSAWRNTERHEEIKQLSGGNHVSHAHERFTGSGNNDIRASSTSLRQKIFEQSRAAAAAKRREIFERSAYIK